MGLQPFSSNSTVFNENRIANMIAALTPTLGVNGPLQRNQTDVDEINQRCIKK